MGKSGEGSRTIEWPPQRETDKNLSPNVERMHRGRLKGTRTCPDDPESRPTVPCNELVDLSLLASSTVQVPSTTAFFSSSSSSSSPPARRDSTIRASSARSSRPTCRPDHRSKQQSLPNSARATRLRAESRVHKYISLKKYDQFSHQVFWKLLDHNTAPIVQAAGPLFVLHHKECHRNPTSR